MKLSILIPARNEMFLAKTIENLLENTGEETEIIAVLDGQWADPPIPQHPRVNVVYVPESIGQRAAQNLACKLAKGKYVAKIDAHCSVDKDFDKKMVDFMERVGDDVVAVPIMRNLWAFDWKCYHCGWKKYQGPTPNVCEQCGKTDKIRRKIMWVGKQRPQSTSYCFDNEPHFQYHNQFTKTSIYKNGVLRGYRLTIEEPSLSSGVVSLLADFANSHHLSSGIYSFWGGQDMALYAMRFSSVDSSGSVGTTKILGVRDELEVDGVTTSPVFTEMVKNGNVFPTTSGERADQPRISDSMGECFFSEMSTATITPLINPASPIPTTGAIINSNTLNELNSILGGQFVYNEKTSSFHNGSVALTPIYDKSMNETMSLQGSFFMSTRENYWKWELCDETLGNWGNQGIEVALGAWLNGGRVLVNHATWYAHMFRTQGGDFGFPYENKGSSETKKKTWDKFKNNPKLKDHIKRFMPVANWEVI